MDEFEELLDDAMSAFEEPEEGAEAMDVVSADRLGWALKAIERKRGVLQAAYDERRATLDQVYETERGKLDVQYLHVEGMLERWLLAWNAGDKKKKSHKLPCGVKVSSTAGSIDLIVEKPDEYQAWVKANLPDKIETVEKVKAGEVKKVLVSLNTIDGDDGKMLKTDGVVIDGDGAIIPGVRMAKKPRNVKVSLG